MAYEVTNVSRSLIYDNLDTKGPDGKPEVLAIKVREKRTLTDQQWASRNVQKHVKRGRLRSRAVS